jgi:hypothetical protein
VKDSVRADVGTKRSHSSAAHEVGQRFRRPDPWEVCRQHETVECPNCSFKVQGAESCAPSSIAAIRSDQVPFDRPVVGYGSRRSTLRL